MPPRSQSLKSPTSWSVDQTSSPCGKIGVCPPFDALPPVPASAPPNPLPAVPLLAPPTPLVVPDAPATPGVPAIGKRDSLSPSTICESQALRASATVKHCAHDRHMAFDLRRFDGERAACLRG